MIVNPQVFNYKLAIGTLVATITILAAYSFSSFNDVASENEYLNHEKKLLKSEMNKFIIKNDEFRLENHSLKSEIENRQAKIKITQDSLNLLKVDLEIIPRYKEQIVFLKQRNKELKSDSNESVINALIEEKAEINQKIELQNDVISALEQEKQQLIQLMERGKLIYANSFDARVFRKKNSGDVVQTDRAINAEYVEVCFAIGENPLATKGKRNLYIQILGPDNNVVGDQGAVSFGESSLIYSSKIVLDYNNQTEEICASIVNDENFKKGKYYISVFESDRKLGNTQIDLY